MNTSPLISTHPPKRDPNETYLALISYYNKGVVMIGLESSLNPNLEYLLSPHKYSSLFEVTTAEF
jgi:hypothetical protein